MNKKQLQEMKATKLFEAEYNGTTIQVYKTWKGQIINYDTQEVLDTVNVTLGKSLEK